MKNNKWFISSLTAQILILDLVGAQGAGDRSGDLKAVPGAQPVKIVPAGGVNAISIVPVMPDQENP